jgi:hypothetical protein
MDPKETLKEIRELYKAILEYPHSDNTCTWWGASAENLAELIESLDEWMSKGGFSPWDLLSTPGDKEQDND